MSYYEDLDRFVDRHEDALGCWTVALMPAFGMALFVLINWWGRIVG